MRIKRQRPRRTNEWLSVIESLDKLMAQRAAKKMTRMEKPPIDKGTLSALNTAYASTLRYYSAILAGGSHSPEVEKVLSKMWQKAGTRLKRYDPDLAQHLKAENRYWTKADTWAKETIQKTWSYLNSIRTSSNMIDPDVGGLIRRFSDS